MFIFAPDSFSNGMTLNKLPKGYAKKNRPRSSCDCKQIKTNYETCDRRLKIVSNRSLKAENNLTQYPWI